MTLTAYTAKILVFVGLLACAMLAKAASVRPTATIENSQTQSVPSTSDCAAQVAGAFTERAVQRSSYVLGDSIGFGLQLDGLETQLQAKLGGTSRISYDGGRSITTPGQQIKKTALESVDIDKTFIADASVIVLVLGTNQLEQSFAESQQQLMQKLKAIAPRATYYWVDIGATMSNQVEGWNARNKTIYANARALGYTVISRYKAIFGPAADPLRIQSGQNFPDSPTESGYGGVGNIHGAYPGLSSAIVNAVSNAAAVSHGCVAGA